MCVGQSLGDVGTRGEITTPLLVKSGEGTSGISVPSDQGLKAHTLYEILARFPSPKSFPEAHADQCEFMHLCVQPLTGRMHQIRAHFASIGRPLLGDRKYFDTPQMLGCVPSPEQVEKIFKLSRLFLHCNRMEMRDLEGQLFSAEVPLPEDLQRVLMQLEDPLRRDSRRRKE